MTLCYPGLCRCLLSCQPPKAELTGCATHSHHCFEQPLLFLTHGLALASLFQCRISLSFWRDDKGQSLQGHNQGTLSPRTNFHLHLPPPHPQCIILGFWVQRCREAPVWGSASFGGGLGSKLKQEMYICCRGTIAVAEVTYPLICS